MATYPDIRLHLGAGGEAQLELVWREHAYTFVAPFSGCLEASSGVLRLRNRVGEAWVVPIREVAGGVEIDAGPERIDLRRSYVLRRLDRDAGGGAGAGPERCIRGRHP